MINSNEQIQEVITQIIKQANMEGMPESAEKKFREEMELQITRRLGIIVMQNLNEEGLAEYEKMIEKGEAGDQEKFSAFVAKYIPNYEEKVKEGLGLFIKEVIAATA